MVKETGIQGKNLRDEATKIYRAIFKTDVPPEVMNRYCQAIPALFAESSQKENEGLTDLLRNVSDLEALEIAARRQNKLSLLVSRFQLMVHLAESIPANQCIYINFSDRRIRSYFSLMIGSIRTFYKYMKGCILLRKVGNV